MRRMGKFIATNEFMFSDSAQEVFGKMGFVPIRVELLAYNGTFECIGICHLFEPVAEGSEVTEYRINISEHEDPDIDELMVSAEAI